ncbi:MAG TPA: hypothetical protein ENN25_07630 [Euryarchaeota archaeon]|nr:hypothetical protein [Euryarchaeota archaeon]
MNGGRRDSSALERRLSNITVQTLRNYCDVKGISGSSGLKKKDLVEFIARKADRSALEDFLSSCEADYLIDSFRRAVKWGKNDLIVRLDPRSGMRELHAEFNGLDVGLRRVYYVDFYETDNPKKIVTVCECDDSRKRGLFCPHQMTVLIRGLKEGKIKLNKWQGPMTPEVRQGISAHLPRIR